MRRLKFNEIIASVLLFSLGGCDEPRGVTHKKVKDAIDKATSAVENADPDALADAAANAASQAAAVASSTTNAGGVAAAAGVSSGSGVTFALKTPLRGTVLAIAEQDFGAHILVGGEFKESEAAYFKVLKYSGELDQAFMQKMHGAPDDVVRALAVQSFGAILLGGDFRSVGGEKTPYFARLNATGEVDEAFMAKLGTGFNASVHSIKIQKDGSILVGGAFTQFNGADVSHLVKLSAMGDPDASFGVNMPTPTLAHEEIKEEKGSAIEKKEVAKEEEKFEEKSKERVPAATATPTLAHEEIKEDKESAKEKKEVAKEEEKLEEKSKERVPAATSAPTLAHEEIKEDKESAKEKKEVAKEEEKLEEKSKERVPAATSAPTPTPTPKSTPKPTATPAPSKDNNKDGSKNQANGNANGWTNGNSGAKSQGASK